MQNYEIILVDGNGTSTLDLVSNTPSNEHIIKISSKKGRANQMNAGAKKASSEILLFLHADTLLPNRACDLIVQSLKNVDAGAFDLTFDSKNIFLKTIAKVASLRSRLSRLPYGDQAIFIKKDVFHTLNGYEDLPLMEDVNLMQKLKKYNYKIQILPQCVITSARKWENSGIVYTTLRNWVLIALYYCGVHPSKLAKYYK